MESKTVFIGTDPVLGAVLDDVAGLLAKEGVCINRNIATVYDGASQFSPETSHSLMQDVAVIGVSSRTKLSAGILQCFPRLKGLVFPSIGINGLDLDEAKRRGLVVANGRTAENIESMAESIVMLTLTLFYELQQKSWQCRQMMARPDSKALSARMLKGKTIGLAGYGATAQHVARLLTGWGVNILAHNRRGRISEYSNDPVTFTGLEDLLARSDLVSVHLPLTQDTRHAIGEKELRLMRRGSFLIGTSRGGVIDEAALCRVLQEGHLGGAAIDVFEHEPLLPNHMFRKIPNMILTNHIIGHTRELFDSLAPAMAKNICAILAEKEPDYLVKL